MPASKPGSFLRVGLPCGCECGASESFVGKGGGSATPVSANIASPSASISAKLMGWDKDKALGVVLDFTLCRDVDKFGTTASWEETGALIAW